MSNLTEKQIKNMEMILYTPPHIFHETLYGSHDSMRDWHSILFEQYKLYVEMTDRISERRGHTNTFFISLTTALLAATGTFIAITFDNRQNQHQWVLFLVAALVSMGGIAICRIWRQLLDHYQKLNKAKFTVINFMERKLPAKGFEAEWEILSRMKYTGLSEIEKKIPTRIQYIFILATFTFIFLSFVFGFAPLFTPR